MTDREQTSGQESVPDEHPDATELPTDSNSDGPQDVARVEASGVVPDDAVSDESTEDGAVAEVEEVGTDEVPEVAEDDEADPDASVVEPEVAEVAVVAVEPAPSADGEESVEPAPEPEPPAEADGEHPFIPTSWTPQPWDAPPTAAGAVDSSVEASREALAGALAGALAAEGLRLAAQATKASAAGDGPGQDSSTAAVEAPATDLEPDDQESDPVVAPGADREEGADGTDPEQPVPTPEPEVEPEVVESVEVAAEPAPELEPAPEPEPEPAPEAEAAPEFAPAAAEPDPQDPTSPGDPGAPAALLGEFPAEERKRRWPRTVGRVLAVLVVVGGAYVAAQWFLADRVPAGTVVAGVEIGGLDAESAVERLDTALADLVVEPVPVAAGDQRTSLDPTASGLTFEAQATVDELTGFGLEPVRLWQHVVGGGAVAPVTTVDRAALDQAVVTLADALDTNPVNGTVAFVDGAVSTTDPVDGLAVDTSAAAELLTAEWLTAARPVELPTETVTPEIDQDALDRAVTDLARPLAEAPVAVAVDDQLADLPVSILTDTARFEPEGGDLVLTMDGPALVDAVLARTRDLLKDPSDAEFAFEDDKPVVVPGVPGTTLDPEMLADAVAAAATSADRTARVELVESDPANTTEALEALGITEIVSEFDTPLNSEPLRTKNITAGAAAVNGTLVRPDETFSLTEALGPIDAAHGFVQAGAIINGEHSDAWGGGLSQLSTTTYNAAYFAGFVDVEHHPHSEWFARYPMGREATIFTGTLDMQWQNNTPYGALVQAWIADGSVHVRIWGTKYWTVESTTSDRYDVVRPTVVYSESPTCSAQSSGNSGFSVTVRRVVSRDDEVFSDETWNVRYRPQNAIVCGPAPTETP